MDRPLSIPLFPLPNVVHFPRTDLELHIFEPRYRQLVRDLLALPPEERVVGMVVLAPGASQETPAIFAAGTAGRMVEVEDLPEGRSNIRLRGQYRFEVSSEVDPQVPPTTPYRRALVHPIEESAVDERAQGVRTLRSNLMRTALGLSEELSDRFPVSLLELRELEAEPLESLVNGLCARLDLPVLRRLELLSLDLVSRSDSLLRQLEKHRSALDQLRPFRQLAAHPDLN